MLDRDQLHVVALLVDFAHTASVVVWLGGLLALVYVLPRATDDGTARTTAVRRFSTAALVAVTVIGLSGIGRALGELSAGSQLWSTSYGRALLVKTALFVPLLGLGWLNRSLLIRAFTRLRRSALAEVTLLLGVVVAVSRAPPGCGSTVGDAALSRRRNRLRRHAACTDARELGPLACSRAHSR
jgi:copper transport protein